MASHYGEGWDKFARQEEAERISNERAVDLTREGPSEQEVAMCHFYHENGTLAATAAFFQVPVYQVQRLSQQQWWVEEIRALRAAEAAYNNARFTKLINTTLTKLETRIEEGDIVLDKKGCEHLIPVDAATLAKVLDVVFDKRQVIQGLPTTILSEDKSKIEELARKLEQLGQAQSAKILNPPDRS